MTREEVLAVRRLDVKWARKRYPFTARSQSEVTGEWHTADETALAALHLARTRVGTKLQQRQSKEWLRRHASIRVFDRETFLHFFRR